MLIENTHTPVKYCKTVVIVANVPICSANNDSVDIGLEMHQICFFG